MLILTRRIDEAVRIGGEVTVKILSVRGTHVRIGITAPKVVPIKREELFQRELGLDGEMPPPR